MDIKMSKISVRIGEGESHLFSIDDLRVSAGEKILIKGPSGKGKSTFLHLLAGLIEPTTGKLFYGDTDFTKLNEDERCLFRRNHISLVFQKLNLIDHLTPIENIELGANHPLSVEDIKQILHSVGLSGKESERTSVLSLGEQQRVAIARTLASPCKVLLADEPSSSLDDQNAASIIELLLQSSTGKTLIAVSHDLRIEKHFDRVLQFEEFAR